MEQVGSDLRADLQQLVAFNLRPHLKTGRLGDAILLGWCSLCRGWDRPYKRSTYQVSNKSRFTSGLGLSSVGDNAFSPI